MDYSDFEHLCKELTAAEWQALEVHRYYLSERAGHDVGIVRTVEDWLLHHSANWRKEKLQRDLADQAKEIMKHKWIESEKAGTDLGNAAALDWVRIHGGVGAKRALSCIALLYSQTAYCTCGEVCDYPKRSGCL